MDLVHGPNLAIGSKDHSFDTRQTDVHYDVMDDVDSDFSLPIQPWPKKGDRLIDGDDQKRIYNAWISNWNSLSSHIEGYERASTLIWGEIRSNPRLAGIDFLVYPFIFLCRHFVELSLKDILVLGGKIEESGVGFPHHHRLLDLWNLVQITVQQIEGNAYDDDLDAMTALIKEFDKIDPHSIAFRYPMSKDGSPSVHGVEWLNLAIFQGGMEKISAFFYGVRCQFDSYITARGF